MRVIGMRVGKKPELVEIEGYDGMKEYVGGWIEAVPIGDGLIAIVNEEGKLHDLPFNRILYSAELDKPLDVLVGDFFICAVGTDDFDSVGLEEIEAFFNKVTETVIFV